MGLKFPIRVHVDASAALGIINRKGVGRVRHLDTSILWVQQKELKERLMFQKVLGTENPSDLMTKYLTKESIDKNMDLLNMTFEDGRAVAAAKVYYTRAWKHQSQRIIAHSI